MAPKRPGEPSSHETAKKVPKLINEEASNVNDAGQIQKSNSYYCARYLAQRFANIEASSKVTMPLLKFCVQHDSEDVVRQFLDKEISNLKTIERSELLWTAIDSGRQDMIEDLIRSGADLSVRKYDDNRTLLHEVLRSSKLSKKEELVRLMLNLGADVNALDFEGHSVLHEAIKRDNCSIQLVEDLLHHGARVSTNKNSDFGDLRLACENKLELLPRLIEHRVPDEETRNRRGIFVINCLVAKRYSGARSVAAMRMVERILDLGVPVNATNSFLERCRDVLCDASPLQMALWCKNKKAIKLLLDRGADPHLIDSFGYTSLHQASKFKASTEVSRWLIERGVSIHTPDHDGVYPIHAACNHESLRNLHLLINLGADLTVTDNHGRPPFRFLRMSATLKCKDAQRLVIKHFALIVAKGGSIDNKDMAKICRYEWSAIHFEKCKEQLELMREEKIWKNVSYFSLFTRDMYSMIGLVRNKKFVERFKRDEKRRVDLFPEYSHMLLQCFEIAESRLKMSLAEKDQLHEAFGRAVPEHIVENIAYYTSFEKLELCRHDYYMSFHANLKNTKTDKAKIL